jgi:hypothetical protein
MLFFLTQRAQRKRLCVLCVFFAPFVPEFRIRIIDKLPKIKRFARQGININRKNNMVLLKIPRRGLTWMSYGQKTAE